MKWVEGKYRLCLDSGRRRFCGASPLTIEYARQIKNGETSASEDALGGTDVGAIRLVHDPTSFAEKLFSSLKNGGHVRVGNVNRGRVCVFFLIDWLLMWLLI